MLLPVFTILVAVGYKDNAKDISAFVRFWANVGVLDVCAGADREPTKPVGMDEPLAWLNFFPIPPGATTNENGVGVVTQIPARQLKPTSHWLFSLSHVSFF